MTEEIREDTDPIYKRVDAFVKKFHEKDLILKPEARTLIVERTMGTDFFGRSIKKEFSLADIIAEHIAEYTKVQCLMDETVAFYSKQENKPDSILYLVPSLLP